MDFDSRTLQKKHRQKITVEIDILGDEIDEDRCEKIADSFTDFVRQIWCLSDPQIAFAINSKVSVQPTPQKTHDQVRLPCANATDR
jgi:hypothetical protein